MSGHSKWATMHRKKEKIDAKRGKIFTKMGRDIMVAAKEGGPDPNTNNKLRDAITKAKAANMPNENIQRLLKRAAGAAGGAGFEEVIYEGYGPGGVAFIVEAATDNRNRTASEVRHYFDRAGGSLGASGCVAWMFDRKGLLVLERTDDMDEDEIMMQALEAGAEDISAELSRIPQNTVAADEELVQKLERLIDLLEENDDVQSVFHNAEM